VLAITVQHDHERHRIAPARKLDDVGACAACRGGRGHDEERQDRAAHHF
jgi:hypothetical protein